MKSFKLESTNSKTEYLYRCEAIRYFYTVDAELEIYGTTPPKIEIRKYEIVRRTAKGAWILDDCLEKKFVLLSARKKFACETVKQAAESMIARRNRQMRILAKQLRRCEEDVKVANYYLASAKGESN